jgi:hypothetical protein
MLQSEAVMHRTAASPIDRNAETFLHAVQRVKAEFMEMPGLTLTLAQAARLWAFDPAFCAAVLAALEETRFLVRTRRSAFARPD